MTREASRHKLPTRPENMTLTSVYRMYDSDGELLYVGMTMDLAERTRKHKAAAPWWKFVARVDVEHFDSRERAAAAERAAIDGEAPMYNLDGGRERAWLLGTSSDDEQTEEAA